MATYLARLNGWNFLMNTDGEPKKKRFSATRLVEAANQKQAETLALDLIRNDTGLQNSILNEASDPPAFSIESVSEIAATAYDAQVRNFTFFWKDD